MHYTYKCQNQSIKNSMLSLTEKQRHQKYITQCSTLALASPFGSTLGACAKRFNSYTNAIKPRFILMKNNKQKNIVNLIIDSRIQFGHRSRSCSIQDN